MKQGSPLNSSRLRLSITVVIVLMVISSLVFILVNPSLKAAPLSAPSTISQDGGDFTTQAEMCCVTARPTNNIVNTNSFYDVVFLTATSGAIKNIHVTFPAGTVIPSGAFFNEAEGIGPGTASRGVGPGQTTITYTVTNAVNVPVGTKIRLEFANINNPLSPSASYKVTVITTNAALEIIDGPTESTAYTIKQIGKNTIADGHVTTPKIADSAVTSEKIADGAIQPQVITRVGPIVSVPPGESSGSTAFCLTGEVPVSGGVSVFFGGEPFLTITDQGVNGNGWFNEMFNSDPTNSHAFDSKVTCMPAMP